MPFVGDMPEEKTVLKFFMYLAETNGNLLKPHLKRLVEVIEGDLAQAEKLKFKEPLLTQLKEFHGKLKTLL